jgi:hypothetical protein
VRLFEQIVPNPSELKEMNFMDLIRSAHEAVLIQGVPDFRIYVRKEISQAIRMMKIKQ